MLSCPDPSTESCIQAGLWQAVVHGPPLSLHRGGISLSPAIKAELWGQLLWAEGRLSQQPGGTTTQWAPHPHTSQLCWSHVGLINTQWPCREQGETHFLGLSFLVLACGVSVPSVVCPLSGKNTEDGGRGYGEEGKGSWLPLMALLAMGT